MAQLEQVVGQRGTVAPDNAAQFLVDWASKYSGAALGVVRPGTTQEVAAVVRLCNENRVAIVPQGGNTGLCGGATPLGEGNPESRDCIVLSLSRMNEIESVNPERATVTAQAGVTVQAVREACAAEGLLFGPDWGARGSAQVGGGVSTNAGGLNVLRWGGMREQVLGLEVILPMVESMTGCAPLEKTARGWI